MKFNAVWINPIFLMHKNVERLVALSSNLFNLGSHDGSSRLARKELRTVLYFIVMASFVTSTLSSAQNTTTAKSFRDCPDCPEMAIIPPGIFMMGASKEDAYRYNQTVDFIQRFMLNNGESEEPQHKVTIPRPFALGKYPVTRGEFAKFIHETGYNANKPCTVRVGRRNMPSSEASWSNPGFTQEDRDPVVCVTWADANAYTTWLNKKIKSSGGAANAGSYRLPSEAEYEYAARGGTTTLRWWGDDIGRNKAVCDGCGSPWDGQQPAPVGLYGANQYGVSDILGNIWEWTQDCWNENYEQAPVDGSPWLAGNCELRVMRGGSWQSDGRLVSSELRSHSEKDSADFHIGFRVVKSLQ